MGHYFCAFTYEFGVETLIIHTCLYRDVEILRSGALRPAYLPPYQLSFALTDESVGGWRKLFMRLYVF